jgi:hypothetical protein
MQAITTTGHVRTNVMDALRAMPAALTAAIQSIPAERLTDRGPDDSFSAVEQVWHLADLEREAYSVRIRVLRHETNPRLADFPGDVIAQQRNYRERDLAEGLAAFERAREENIDALRAVAVDEWQRAGEQESVGKVMLCDVPQMMCAHDTGHLDEIQTLRRYLGASLQ